MPIETRGLSRFFRLDYTHGAVHWINLDAIDNVYLVENDPTGPPMRIKFRNGQTMEIAEQPVIDSIRAVLDKATKGE